MVVSFLPITAWAAMKITSLTITNIPTPRPGRVATLDATVETPGAEVDSLFWYDVTAGEFIYSGTDTFVKDHVYQVQIWVAAKDGYEFQYINSLTPNVTATIMGNTATVTKAYEYAPWAMVVASYTFAPCAEKTIQSVNIELYGVQKEGNVLCATEGITIPYSLQTVSDDIALYPELNLNRYHPYGFLWKDTCHNTQKYYGDVFKGGHDYYVHIAIKPVGCKFTDDLTVTIAGKKATIKTKGPDYAEVGIEVTCYGSIYSSDINPVIILPKAGNYPDYEKPYNSSASIEYSYVSGWYDVESGNRLSSNDTFVAGKQYRVEITCTAAYPYKFARDANGQMAYLPMITGHEVDSYSFGFDDYRFRELIHLVKTFTASGTVNNGDLDGNGTTDNKDVEYLLWHTLFPDSYPITQNADYNGDSKVDNKDVEYLLWHTLFPDTYPLSL